jgi:hypothetical protein
VLIVSCEIVLTLQSDRESDRELIFAELCLLDCCHPGNRAESESMVVQLTAYTFQLQAYSLELTAFLLQLSGYSLKP